MREILTVENIYKSFDGLRVLNGISLNIQMGTINGLIGPNGAGKTTLFNIINGFLKPDSGKVYFMGHELTGLPPYKISSMGIGRTFQRPKLFLQITVIDNILLAMRYNLGEDIEDVLFRYPAVMKEDKEKYNIALKYLKFVELDGKKDVLAENLSYGQRKLLELARALATDANLLLLDEPFAGVFPYMREKIKNILLKIKKLGKTIIFIEHMINIVSSISDKIIFIAHGEKIAEGDPIEVLNNKRVIETYFGEDYGA